MYHYVPFIFTIFLWPSGSCTSHPRSGTAVRQWDLCCCSRRIRPRCWSWSAYTGAGKRYHSSLFSQLSITAFCRVLAAFFRNVLKLLMTYTQLLQKAQLATTREEARKCLQLAYQYELIENSYQSRALHVAMNRWANSWYDGGLHICSSQLYCN